METVEPLFRRDRTAVTHDDYLETIAGILLPGNGVKTGEQLLRPVTGGDDYGKEWE
jgi:hypothetical protein